MNKNNKRIEIKLVDAKVMVEGQIVEGLDLVIGKKTIGSVVELDSKFATVISGQVDSFFKTLDLAMTHIVERYNLSH